MLISRLQIAYKVTSKRVLENSNLKNCHIKRSFILNINRISVHSSIIIREFCATFRTLSNNETKRNIRLNKHESIDTFTIREQPQSISYFTAKPTYNDLIIQLDELISNYRTAPKVRNDSTSTLWKLKKQLDEELGSCLKTNQYRIIIQKLNQLNKIKPEISSGLDDFLDLFKRYDPEKEKKLLESMKTVDKYGRAFALGKRKEAVAQVWVVEGDGHVLVNGKPASEYFSLLNDRESILFPFEVTGLLGKYNVWTKVKGGGPTGQAGAIAHGITKALIIHNSDLKPILRAANLVTRDTRVVERKKPGLAKARKRYTWVKR